VNSAEEIIQIENNGELKFSAYPNPTSGLTVIALENYNQEINYEISLSAINGKTVFSQELTNIKTDLDFGHLKSGIYFISVKAGQDVYTIKLLKTN